MAWRAARWRAASSFPASASSPRLLLVHPNTVARAFQDLEREGIVTARRGVGMEVTDGARALCKAKRRDIIQTRIRQALARGCRQRPDCRRIRRLVEEELTAANGKRRK